ncbi:MAG: hypothetical protein LC776_06175 [Acidobacteria bacterium]|nr:hypothetical protein [Acidobacteriota bacterium]
MHALSESILLDRQFESMGAGRDLVRSAFGSPTGGGYRQLVREHAAFPPRERGEWREYADSRLQIYLQRNVYAYTMVGIDDVGNMVASAAGGRAGKVGHSLEGMAQNMIGWGARDVLLIDEGDDVFQMLLGPFAGTSSAHPYTVEPRRGRLRAVFAFGQRERALTTGHRTQSRRISRQRAAPADPSKRGGTKARTSRESESGGIVAAGEAST